MFTAVVFITDKNQKQPKCLSIWKQGKNNPYTII